VQQGATLNPGGSFFLSMAVPEAQHAVGKGCEAPAATAKYWHVNTRLIIKDKLVTGWWQS